MELPGSTVRSWDSRYGDRACSWQCQVRTPMSTTTCRFPTTVELMRHNGYVVRIMVPAAVLMMTVTACATANEQPTAPQSAHTSTAPVRVNTTSETVAPHGVARHLGGIADPSDTFHATVQPIVGSVAARIVGHSWRQGCPVPIAQLRYVRIPYWGFDGIVHRGELIVHQDAVDTILMVFKHLQSARFPIERMQLVDDFAANDDRSTLANNTSAFNCRAVTGGHSWSQHAYGRAMDINPVQNPYVYRDGHVLDPAAITYLDRNRQRPGMIAANDVATAAFARAGWGWGGDFVSFKDYQHFSATGG